VKEWVKGEPVKAFAHEQIYVLVFWNTWASSSHTGIAHLTELQKNHPDVILIGITVYEHEIDQRRVAPFVRRKGDQMGYRVATDDVPEGQKTDQGAMWKSWMLASGTTAVPTAFVVDKGGKIAWIGHDQGIDQPLEAIIAGKWDTAAFRKQKAEDDLFIEAAAHLQDEIDAAVQAKNTKPMIAAIDEAVAKMPRLEEGFGHYKFEFLLDAKDFEAAYSYGSKLVGGAFKDNATELNNLAWKIVDPDAPALEKRDLKLALKAALRATEVTRGIVPGILDTLAKVYFDSGEVAKAIQTQTRALELVKGTEAEKEFQGHLDAYKKLRPAGG
jgi:thiol-disulfide isomerase/thioredoxin